MINQKRLFARYTKQVNFTSNELYPILRVILNRKTVKVTPAEEIKLSALAVRIERILWYWYKKLTLTGFTKEEVNHAKKCRCSGVSSSDNLINPNTTNQ